MSFLAAIPIIGDLIKGAESLISEAITDKDKKNELNAQLKRLQLETENRLLEREHDAKIAQIEVNKEEAKSKSLFVAGWRPAVGWTCCFAMVFNFIIQPLILWILPILSVWYPEAAKITPPPALSLGEMLPILMGMLGLGAYRTYEKKNGVNNK